MKSNKLLLLAVVTLLALLAAFFMSKHRAPTTSLETQTLFPELLERVNEIKTIELAKHNRKLSLAELNGTWVISNADNYPADFGKVKSTLLELAELEILANKTRNAERYERLGVEDPFTDGANSLLLSVKDGGSNILASLIVGKARHSKAAEDKAGLYVRLPEQDQALLVEGKLDVSANVSDWFTRELFNIGSSRIKQVEILHSDGSSVNLSREQDIDNLAVMNIPEGKEAQSDVIITRMGTLLEDIFVDNVIKAEKLDSAEQTIARVETFDGLTVTITSARLDETNYSSFEFSAKEAASESDSEDEGKETSRLEEAAELNRRLQGWAFAIPDFKFELFTRTLDSLTRTIEAKETEAGTE